METVGRGDGEMVRWLLILPINHASAGTSSKETPQERHPPPTRTSHYLLGWFSAGGRQTVLVPACPAAGSQLVSLFSFMSGQTSILNPMWDN